MLHIEASAKQSNNFTAALVQTTFTHVSTFARIFAV